MCDIINELIVNIYLSRLDPRYSSAHQCVGQSSAASVCHWSTVERYRFLDCASK